MRGGRALVVVALAAGACNTGKTFSKFENVKPPAPGVPAAAKDLQGIYRNTQHDLLQLRGNGDLNLTTVHGADAGTYTLEGGRLEIRTSGCGAWTGRYRVEVTGPQRAGQAALHLTADDDGCRARRDALIALPWVYANS